MSGYDAVVVGGRVAGAATALLLARAGLRVAVVERARPGTDTVSTHAFMRAGVLQLSRWGLLDAVEAAGTPPVRRTVFHYPDAATREGHAPVHAGAWTRSTRRAAPCSTGSCSTRPRDGRGRRRPRGRSPTCCAIAATGWSAYACSCAARVRARPCRAGSPSAPTASPPSSLARSGREVLSRGRHASAVLYRYFSRRCRPDGYEWGYGPGTARRPDPDQRRARPASSSRTTPAADARAATQRGRGCLRHACCDAIARAARLTDASRPRPGGRLHGWAESPGLRPPCSGPGLGSGRRRRLLQGPDHHARDDRRPARRRSCWPTPSLAATAGGTPEQVALARYQAHARPALPAPRRRATEAVAALRLGHPDHPAPAARGQRVDERRAGPPRRPCPSSADRHG